MNLETYRNSWALVTGASSGIGKEFAKALAKKKINLVLLARRLEVLEKLADDLKDKNKIEIRCIRFDLNETGKLNEVYKFCKDINIEILINNAGFGNLGELTALSEEKIIEMINVNCTSPVLLTKYFIKKMKTRKRGKVIFLGSILAYFPTPMMALYSSTKVFNAFMGESLSFELEKYNIKSYVLNPGSTDTDFHKIANNNKGVMVRTPKQVVESFLSGNTPVFDDGILNRFFIFLKRFLPRKLIYYIMEKFIKGNNNL